MDLICASTFYFSACLAEENDKIEVGSGVNLPILLESAVEREGTGLHDLAALTKKAGTEAIANLFEKLHTD